MMLIVETYFLDKIKYVLIFTGTLIIEVQLTSKTVKILKDEIVKLLNKSIEELDCDDFFSLSRDITKKLARLTVDDLMERTCSAECPYCGMRCKEVSYIIRIICFITF